MQPIASGDREKSRSPNLRFGIGLLLALILFGAGAASGVYFLAGRSSGNPRVTLAMVSESAPSRIRDGDRIAIPDGSPLRAKLTVDVVGEKEIERKLVLPAVVEADPGRLVKVAPPLSGRVTQLKVQLGERVHLGQPLVILDSTDLGTAYADHDRGKAVLALARKNRDRIRDLARIGGAALKDQQQAETDFITAEVELQRAEARLRQIGVKSDAAEVAEAPEAAGKQRTVTVFAPMSGSVIDLVGAPGAYWNDATAALMTIADLSTVWVTANVPEKDTALVAKGQPVEVVFPAYPSEVFRGEVLFVSDVLDSDTRRTKVRISFGNPGMRLKPNMFASVSFFAPKETMPVIPTTALILKNDGDRVFVEVAPWTFEARPVEISFQQGKEALVKSGVKAGDRVVVKGGVLLND